MARRKTRVAANDEEAFFQQLVTNLADDLCDLPPEAWTARDSLRADGPAALADRLARLKAGRASMRADEDEQPPKRRTK